MTERDAAVAGGRLGGACAAVAMVRRGVTRRKADGARFRAAILGEWAQWSMPKGG
ncbi:MAG: hypothetical protein ISS56_15950 [Anaerolineae bacterium]|nr:hypothetical protein [Anaerolineae bacterium]